MDQRQLVEVNKELAALASELQNRQSVAYATAQPAPADVVLQYDPSGLFGRAIRVLKAPDAGPRVSADDIAFSIRLLAAKVRGGDIEFVIESLVGQSLWLQSAAAALALELDGMKTGRDKRSVGELLLKFQTTATRTLEVLAQIAAARAPQTFG